MGGLDLSPGLDGCHLLGIGLRGFLLALLRLVVRSFRLLRRLGNLRDDLSGLVL